MYSSLFSDADVQAFKIAGTTLVYESFPNAIFIYLGDSRMAAADSASNLSDADCKRSLSINSFA